MRDCSKCGGTDVSVEWKPGLTFPTAYAHDFLLKTCKTCGFYWKENCKDRPAAKTVDEIK